MQLMGDDNLRVKYENLYFSLKDIIKKSESKVLNDEDELFMSNVNFFVKSYLISICTYLEAYLQDIAFIYANEVNARLKNAEVPSNYIQWRLSKDIKDKDLAFSNIDLSITKKDISDNLSANPYKTIKLFQYLGINLTIEDGFESNKALVNSVVTKRNNIVHHNDKAMDISFSDLLSYIDVFILYMRAIDDAVCRNGEL
jgi:hypothetical protein